jgi:alpha-tubulin suppressor-like RCC1 family protein
VAGHTDGSNRYGALQVQGLPDPTEVGNRPIQLLGGYQTYWVLLENGDVYYFGGTPPGLNLGWDSDWERAEGDQPNQYSGRTGTSYPDGTAQIAVKSRALAPWFRSVNPDEYVVQVHSGSAAGVAMLSTGRLLTWGTESPDDYDGGAIGRQCPSSPAATRNACYHRPAPVDFKAIRPQPSIVRVSAAFTGVTALAEDGTLYGWGGAHTSWEGYPDYWKPKPGVSSEVPEYASSFTGDGGVIVVARNVVDFQDGQGYIMWWERDGSHWARGWNRYGQAGHTAANWGVGGLSARHDETRTRQVWFSKPQYEDCKPEWVTPAWDDLSVQDPLTERLFKIGKDYTTTYNGTEYYCSDLNIKNPDGTWANRYTFEQCLAGMCAAP